jgi:hypothetical protein
MVGMNALLASDVPGSSVRDPVTVAVTAFSGDGDGRSFVIASADVLPRRPGPPAPTA